MRASPRGRHSESPPAFFLTIVDSTDASILNEVKLRGRSSISLRYYAGLMLKIRCARQIKSRMSSRRNRSEFAMGRQYFFSFFLFFFLFKEQIQSAKKFQPSNFI